jgi:hypothetical protein
VTDHRTALRDTDAVHRHYSRSNPGSSKSPGGLYGPVAKSISFGWQPGNAYLAEKKKMKEEENE